MTTEPEIGDRVRFRESGARRCGTVREVLTAGKPNGVGSWRQRRRVRVLFEDSDGHRWEPFRDVDAVEPEGQRGLFDEVPA